MQVDRYLYFFSVAITFTIRVAVVWLLCFLFSQLLRRPNHRFLLWLSFSLGSAAYWCATLGLMIALPRNAPGVSHPIPFSHFTVPAAMEQPFAAAAWFLIGAYLVGFISLLILRIWSRMRLRALLRLGARPSPEFVDALQSVCREFGVKRCELLILPGMASPATVYWWRPRIILPEICHRQDRIEQFIHIMRHELVHIRRRDFLVATIMDWVCSLVCFHPLLWLARKRMRMERELACDLAVVAARPENRADYAASLAQFLRWRLTSRNTSAVQFAAPAALLGTRIRTILRDPVAAPVWKRLSSVACGVAMALAFTFMAPEISFSLNLAAAGQQLASAADLIPAQTFKHHLRSSMVVQVRPNVATHGVLDSGR